MKSDNKLGFGGRVRGIRQRYRITVSVLGALIIALAVFAAFAAFALFAYASEPGSTADPIALKSYVDSKIDDLEAKLVSMIQGSGQSALQGGAQQGSAQQSGAQQGDAQQGGAQQGGAPSGDPASIAALTARIDALAQTVDGLKDENNSLRQSIRQLAGGTAGGGVGAGTALTDAGRGENQFFASDFTAIEVFANQRIIFGAGAEIVLRTGVAHAIHGELGALVDLISGQDLEAGQNVPINHLILSPRSDNRGVRIAEDAWILIKGQYEFR